MQLGELGQGAGLMLPEVKLSGPEAPDLDDGYKLMMRRIDNKVLSRCIVSRLPKKIAIERRRF